MHGQCHVLRCVELLSEVWLLCPGYVPRSPASIPLLISRAVGGTLNSKKHTNQLNCFCFVCILFDCSFRLFVLHGRPGVPDGTLLSGISGLSLDSPFRVCFLGLLPSLVALSVWSFFC